MDSDSWISARLSSSSRRYHSRSDLYLGGLDDTDGGDDFRAEFLCPFCAEDYDVVGLCCHIDEDHPLEAKNGVCPVCGKKVGMDLVGHITTQHGNRKRRVRKGGSSSTFSILRKELREGALQSLLGGSSYVASSNSEPDPLLSSFIFNPVVADESVSVQSCPSIEVAPVKESSKDDFLERKIEQLQLSDEDQVEKARRFDFVQGLLMSTILDDKL
ncbi:protein DEHYDRATION-INDUCED 19 homolog 4-like isoform X2 [Gastrolobium bilobum]|uniref:protein DEHYDRATION-INDUCED 19 homolog 4-like isoform X2 n=1 Tax=Gastrolobium bilobum TaxID=150636 RepID=UPI002AB23492|nr:protein DEHYDRATION-INDUCED 19 homolog 4-like isoform X2 [Gastrolobium bilobum]